VFLKKYSKNVQKLSVQSNKIVIAQGVLDGHAIEAILSSNIIIKINNTQYLSNVCLFFDDELLFCWTNNELSSETDIDVLKIMILCKKQSD
jgi:hypothetical protein